MTTLFLAVPSYRGITDKEARDLIGADELERAGLAVVCAVVRQTALLDLARNELLAAAHDQGADYLLFQDDDARTAPSSIREMIAAADRLYFPVLSAPVQMRTEAREPNIVPIGPPINIGDGQYVCEIAWTGLGSVLISRETVATIIALHADRHYRSHARPGKLAWNIFRSDTVPAKAHDPNAAEDDRDFLGDDRIFGHMLREAGVKLRAWMFAVTDHRGMGRYCLGEVIAGHEARESRMPNGRII